jgi:hypothetical protein
MKKIALSEHFGPPSKFLVELFPNLHREVTSFCRARLCKMRHPQASLGWPLLAFFGRDRRVGECLLLREERKSELRGTISVFDPERTVDLNGLMGNPSRSPNDPCV